MPSPSYPLTVVLTYAGSARATLLRVRASLRRLPSDCEILIVGRQIDKAEYSKLTSQFASQPNIVSINYDDDAHEIALRNRAAKRANGHCLLFVPADTTFDKMANNIAELMAQRATDATVGAVGCLQLDTKKRIRHAGLFQLPGHPLARLYYGDPIKKSIRFLGTRTYPYDLRRSRPVLAVSGALLVSRNHFRQIGGFVDTEEATTETAEIDLCLRLNKHGWQTWLQSGGSLLVGETDTPLDDGYVHTFSDPLHSGVATDPHLPRLTDKNLPRARQRVQLAKRWPWQRG